MKLRHLYLISSAFGLLLPYSQFVPWLLSNGLNFHLFFHELFANEISGFFVMDVVVAAVVLLVFICSEGRLLGARGLWLPILGLVTVGVSLGLPLFLYFRQVHLQQTKASSGTVPSCARSTAKS